MTDRTEAIRARLEPVVADLGCTVYDLAFTGGSGRPTLQVVLDRLGGLDLDTIEEATRQVSDALDAVDVLRGAYTLEVSSPGRERALRRPEHFAGALGSTVSVKVRDEQGQVERVRGELTAADVRGIEICTDEGPRRVTFAGIESARTVFTWGPAPKPGKGSKPGRAKKEVATS